MMVAFVGSLSTFAQSNNDVVGIAKGALLSTCNVSGNNLQAKVATTGICFVEGTLKDVTFYRTPQCPANQPCIQIVELVGVVSLDCENNVTGVQCYGAVAQ